MKIILSPQRRDDNLVVVKAGDVLVINHTSFDLSAVGEGGTLPREATDSIWIAGDVHRVNGELQVTLLFPNPINYSQEQAFPVPLEDVPDGLVVFPEPNMPDGETYIPPVFDESIPISQGIIDWSQLITQEMKDAEKQAQILAAAKLELNQKNLFATTQISRIQDRIETIGFGIEIGEATPEDEQELVELQPQLTAWKKYKFALGKVTSQTTWPNNPVWPIQPPVPVIEASPMFRTEQVETM